MRPKCSAVQDYDGNGEYVKAWLPELAKVPVNHVHEPWKMSPQEQEHAGCRIGHDYPEPLSQPPPGLFTRAVLVIRCHITTSWS